MGRRIAPGVYTYANGTAYGPGDEPTPEDAAEIRNPACWEDGQAPVEEPAPPVDSGPGDGGEQDGPVPGPPRSGRGSGLTVWVDFAQDHSIATVNDKGEPLSRDEIIDACVAAKVIEPEGDDGE